MIWEVSVVPGRPTIQVEYTGLEISPLLFQFLILHLHPYNINYVIM